MPFETCVRFYFTIALLNFAWYINRVWYRWFHLRIVNRVLIRRDYFVASVDLHHIYHTQSIHRPTLAPQHPDTDKRLINALNSEQTDRHPTDDTFKLKFFFVDYQNVTEIWFNVNITKSAPVYSVIENVDESIRWYGILKSTRTSHPRCYHYQERHMVSYNIYIYVILINSFQKYGIAGMINIIIYRLELCISTFIIIIIYLCCNTSNLAGSVSLQPSLFPPSVLRFSIYSHYYCGVVTLQEWFVYNRALH